MVWPFQDWRKSGAGIPKELPAKKGLALFADVIWREAGSLFLLNLLVIAASLPLVTLPAAHAAALRVTAQMVRDENTYLWRDFWSAFRELFGRASLLALAFLPVIGVAFYAVFVWAQITQGVPFAAAAVVISVAVSVFVVMVLANAFVLLATTKMVMKTLLRTALFAALAHPLPILAGLAFAGSLWLAHIVFYPISIFMPAVMNFSLGVLGVAFAGLHVLNDGTAHSREDQKHCQSGNFAAAQSGNNRRMKCEI